jgi:hypothetical protein
VEQEIVHGGIFDIAALQFDIAETVDTPEIMMSTGIGIVFRLTTIRK